jgi:hypothetical protein
LNTAIQKRQQGKNAHFPCCLFWIAVFKMFIGYKIYCFQIGSRTCAVAWNKVGSDMEVMICGERKNSNVRGKWSGFSICDTSKGGRKIML